MTYRLILPFTLLLSSLSATAADRWFEVELLLFQRNVELENVNEHLGNDQINIDLSKSIPLIKTQTPLDCLPSQQCLAKKNALLISDELFDRQTNHFKKLNNNQLQLSAQRDTLSRHAAFTPILHVAWRMPVKSRYAAKPLHIFAGENFAKDMTQELLSDDASIIEIVSDESIENNIDQSTLTEQVMTEQLPPPQADKWAIDGNFKVYLDHFLYIDSQLVIRKEITHDVEVVTAQTDNVEIISSENDLQVIKENETVDEVVLQQVTELKEVLFDQNRRLRSEEIHYFDHPLMGMIVQIRKIPEAELAKLESVPETLATEETNTDNTL